MLTQIFAHWTLVNSRLQKALNIAEIMVSPRVELHVDERRQSNHRHPSGYGRMLERFQQEPLVGSDRDRIYRDTVG